MSVGNSELNKGISWFENASFFKPDLFLCFVDYTDVEMNWHLYACVTWRWRAVNLGLSIWPQKSIKWIIHLWIIKMRLYVNEDQFLFKMRAGPVWPLGGLPDGDQSGGDATQCLEESYCVMLRWWRLKWLFQSLGFVEAHPDVSSTENLSDISSQSKLIWKRGQLKKINKWGEASTSKKKQQQNHTAVLSTLFFQLTCLPSFIPTCPPTSSSSLPNYVLVMSRAQDYYLPLVSGDWCLWVGNQRWKTQEACVVQVYFQLCVLGLCLIPLFPLRNSFGWEELLNY